MLMENERKLIVEYGKLLVTKGLTTGTGGNISIFDKEKKYFAISPSGIDYFETTPEDVVIMDLDGKVVEGIRKPSSEWMMHMIFYKKIAEDCKKHLTENGLLFLEINQKLGRETLELYKNDFSEAELLKDISGNDRLIFARK